MRWRRLRSVVRKETLQIWRDPWSLGMAFAIPMLLLVLFGAVLTLDIDEIPTAVYDQDRTAASRDLLARFQRSSYFSFVATAVRYRDVERALDEGRAKVALVIPRNFARDLARGLRVPVQAIVDGTDSNIATLALSYIDTIARAYSEQIALEQTGRVPRPAAEGRLRIWYNPEMESKNFIVPGLIAVIMMVIASMLTSLTVAREWERGTMEQLIATPVRVPELILGKLAPYFAMAFADVVFCTLVGVFLFGVPFRGSFPVLVAFSALFLVGALSLGLLISVRARSQLLASQLAMLTTMLPAFMLSGFSAPIENMPRWLQLVTYLVPARYFVTVLKAVFLKGVGLRLLALETVFLFLFAAALTAVALRSFRKNLE